MKWFLDISIPDPPTRLRHRDALLLIGSCFTENIGRLLGDLKFDATYNPTGILFDPHSVCRHLNDYIEQRSYSIADLFRHQDVFHSWNHHSRFSHTSPDVALRQINDAVKAGAEALRRARWCVVTLGSSFAYRLKEADARVANCHKVPQTAFAREMMTTEETFQCLQAAFNKIRKINSNVEFILTVSPVRHSRDGLVENNRSKGRLLEAVHRLTETHDFVHYFPAYELVIDVLRDYRFYDIDMVHPNYAATQFVFDEFCKTWIDPETTKLMDEIRPVITAMNHKPQHAGTEAHRDFLKRQLARTETLQRKTPWCDWTKELNFFREG